MNQLSLIPVCEKCGVLKTWQHPKTRKKGWWECRPCKKECAAAWRKANPEKYKAGSLAYRINNPEKIKDRNRAQYCKRREDRIAYARSYRSENREKSNASSYAAKAKKPDKYKAMWREYSPKWRAANPEMAREAYRRHRALKKNATGSEPVTAAIVRERLALTDGCAYCGLGEPLEADHVVALHSGGLHEPCNLIGACRSCNASKSAKPVESWYRAQSFFSEQRWQRLLEVTLLKEAPKEINEADMGTST